MKKIIQVGFRTTELLMLKLTNEAKLTKRSISLLIHHRLEESYKRLKRILPK